MLRLSAGTAGTLRSYLAALACLGAALLLRAAAAPFVGLRYPYVTIYIAILVCARYFGSGPAIAVSLAGGVAATWLFAPPGYPFLPSVDSIGVILYFVVSGLAVILIHWQRRDRALAEANARLADQALQNLLAETEQRERERKLSALLRALVESSDDAIISKDLNGIIQSWNRGAESIFGYTSAEAIGQPITIILPPDRAHEEHDILERIRHGGRVKHFETVRSRKGGAPIPVSLTSSPIYDAAGRIVGASGILRDIGEARELEEQLRQKQKMEGLGVLAGGLAHDFNNILTGIMGNASLALREAQGPVAQRIQEVLNASERAAVLVRQMLAYAGKGRFVLTATNISEEVRQITPLLESSISRLVTIDLQLAPDLPPIEADRSQIQQLIMNLALNGAEAIGEAPGILTVATWARETDQERQVILQVGDTGAGMDEEVKARIFDPFFTTKFTGRGLGLAAVIGIIRGHKGSISVDSSPGRGSSFTIVFPAAAGARAVHPAAEETGELRGYGNILVVDDEELVRNMARYTLEHLGYSVETVPDGLAAVETFSRKPADFDAVLLDLTMPRMNGEQALDRLRAIRPEIPVVLSSGFSEGEALERFRDRGLSAFLQKPYTATALARKIKTALQKQGRVPPGARD